MRSEAFITVTCDSCYDAIKVQLVGTPRGGYDDRNVDAELEGQGWTTEVGRDLCKACAADEVANAAPGASPEAA